MLCFRKLAVILSFPILGTTLYAKTLDKCTQDLSHFSKVEIARDNIQAAWSLLTQADSIAGQTVDSMLNDEFDINRNLELAPLGLSREGPLSQKETDALIEVNDPKFFLISGLEIPMGYGEYKFSQLRAVRGRLLQDFSPADTHMLMKLGLAGRKTQTSKRSAVLTTHLK